MDYAKATAYVNKTKVGRVISNYIDDSRYIGKTISDIFNTYTLDYELLFEICPDIIVNNSSIYSVCIIFTDGTFVASTDATVGYWDYTKTKLVGQYGYSLNNPTHTDAGTGSLGIEGAKYVSIKLKNSTVANITYKNRLVKCISFNLYSANQIEPKTYTQTMLLAPYYNVKQVKASLVNGSVNSSNGYFTSYGTQNYWCHTLLYCAPNDVFYITLKTSNNTSVPHHILFCDDYDLILASHLPYSTTIETRVDYEVVAPKGATKLYVHSFTTSQYLHVSKKTKVELIAKDNVINNTSDVPEYYQTHLNDKITKINSITQKIFNGDSFVFVTDIHIGANSLSSFAMIKEVVKNTSISKVVCGGDICGAYGTAEYCKTAGYVVNDELAEIRPYAPTYQIRGNHDFTVKESAEISTGFTADIAFNYDLVMKNQESYVNGVAGKLYYHIDNGVQKIRYIFLDTSERINAGETIAWGVGYGIYQEQLDWFINTALNVTTGWSVIVIGHISCVSEINDYSDRLDCIAGILKALKNKRSYTYTNATLSLSASVNYTSSNMELIGYVCGHNHKDMNATVDNTLFFSTTCDAHYSDDGIERNRGTISESAFDVISINKTAKTIELTRIGAGTDRSLTYI